MNDNELKKSIRLLDVRVDRVTEHELERLLHYAIQNKHRGWICYLNVHTFQLAQQYSWYKKFLEDAFLVYCDGEGIRLGAYLLGMSIPIRITLTTYLTSLILFAIRENIKIYFLGGEESVIEKSVAVLRRQYPLLQIVGWHHGYFTQNDNEYIIREINKAEPDILLVGLGAPKQEQWVAENFDRINATLVWVGGGFLDTLAGEKIICPRWLANLGFEWLFRLIQEPKRLWRRYLLGNPIFLRDIIVEKIRLLSYRAKNKQNAISTY